MKKVAILLLIMVEATLVAPMLFHGHVLTTILSGSDIKAHMGIINGIGEPLYFGQTMLAFFFRPLAGSPYLQTAYLWFSFAVLLAVPLVLFYVVKQTVGFTSALLVVPMTLFISSGIISLFSYGVIFNIINVYIILPLAILFWVKWWQDRKLWQLVVSIFIFALFEVFHITGLYLLGAILVVIVGGLAYSAWKREFSNLLKFVAIGFASIIAYLSIARYLQSPFTDGDATITSSFPQYLAYVAWSIVNHLSLIIIPLVIVMSWLIVGRKYLQLPTKAKVFLLALCAFMVALCAVLAFGITKDSLFINRIASDATTLMAIGVACILGLWLDEYKAKLPKILVAGAVAIGSIPVLAFWMAR